MGRGLLLRRYEIESADHRYLRVFRLRVEVADTAGGMDPKIFLHRREVTDPETGETQDTFQTVASVVDMSQYPPDSPSTERAYPFFRTDSMEIDLSSVSQYNETWEKILELANHLCTALDLAENLVVADEVWAGQAGDSES